MTKIAREKILEKFQKLDEYLGNLRILQKETKTREQFLKDFHLYGLAERYLQLSSQCLIDILDLIIIAEGLKKPEDRKEAISLLCSQDIISKDLASKLYGISGLRNILVHEYGKIDTKKLYKYLKENLVDFEIFKKEILKWL